MVYRGFKVLLVLVRKLKKCLIILNCTCILGIFSGECLPQQTTDLLTFHYFYVYRLQFLYVLVRSCHILQGAILHYQTLRPTKITRTPWIPLVSTMLQWQQQQQQQQWIYLYVNKIIRVKDFPVVSSTTHKKVFF